jgi:hypothetical protein
VDSIPKIGDGFVPDPFVPDVCPGEGNHFPPATEAVRANTEARRDVLVQVSFPLCPASVNAPNSANVISGDVFSTLMSKQPRKLNRPKVSLTEGEHHSAVIATGKGPVDRGLRAPQATSEPAAAARAVLASLITKTRSLGPRPPWPSSALAGASTGGEGGSRTASGPYCGSCRPDWSPAGEGDGW